MKRIPPDVERLMWLIAEDRDPRAIADFESRFPHLRADLAKHLAMVSGIKGARRRSIPRDIPRFVPRNTPPRPLFNRSIAVAFAFILGAIVFGSIAVGGYLRRPSPRPPVVDKVNLNPLSTTRATKDPIPSGELSPKSGPSLTDGAPPPSQDDPLRKLVTVRVERAPLPAAITMVCQNAGIHVEFGPGLSDEEVGLDYDSWSALDILSDLGKKYGFTAMPQEKGAILVIPARDASHDAEPATTGDEGRQVEKVAPSLAPIDR